MSTHTGMPKRSLGEISTLFHPHVESVHKREWVTFTASHLWKHPSAFLPIDSPTSRTPVSSCLRLHILLTSLNPKLQDFIDYFLNEESAKVSGRLPLVVLSLSAPPPPLHGSHRAYADAHGWAGCTPGGYSSSRSFCVSSLLPGAVFCGLGFMTNWIHVSTFFLRSLSSFIHSSSPGVPSGPLVHSQNKEVQEFDSSSKVGIMRHGFKVCSKSCYSPVCRLIGT